MLTSGKRLAVACCCAGAACCAGALLVDITSGIGSLGSTPAEPVLAPAATLRGMLLAWNTVLITSGFTPCACNSFSISTESVGLPAACHALVNASLDTLAVILRPTLAAPCATAPTALPARFLTPCRPLLAPDLISSQMPSSNLPSLNMRLLRRATRSNNARTCARVRLRLSFAPPTCLANCAIISAGYVLP